jgi:site-specific DNA recombinase
MFCQASKNLMELIVLWIPILEEKFIQEEINRELYDKFLLKYKTEKNNIEEKIGSTRLDLSNLENQIKKYVNICLELPSLWEKASFHAKMEIQNIIFPEGILYDRENGNYRTPKVNSVIRLITSIARSLEEGIKRKAALLGSLSNVVGNTGLEPVTPTLSR